MVEVEQLTKIYGDHLALDAASFVVKKGQVTAFLGPNGAGKTTTMNIVCGYIAASGGRVSINGRDFRDDPVESKRSIGYLPERPPLYRDMLVGEYLDFVSHLKGVPKRKRKAERERLSQSLGLTNVEDRLIGNLSQGYRQRLGVAQALCGSPELLVLDEPTVGLDPRQIKEFRNFILGLKTDHAILISSHILSEVESLCDYLIVINQGRIVAQGTKDQLMETVQARGEQVVIRVRGNEDNVKSILGGIEGVRKLEVYPCEEVGASEYVLYSELGCDIRELIFYVLSKASLPLLLMNRKILSLEDVFLHLTQQ